MSGPAVLQRARGGCERPGRGGGVSAPRRGAAAGDQAWRVSGMDGAGVRWLKDWSRWAPGRRRHLSRDWKAIWGESFSSWRKQPWWERVWRAGGPARRSRWLQTVSQRDDGRTVCPRGEGEGEMQPRSTVRSGSYPRTPGGR